jgi:hypothetical protein
MRRVVSATSCAACAFSRARSGSAESSVRFRAPAPANADMTTSIAGLNTLESAVSARARGARPSPGSARRAGRAGGARPDALGLAGRAGRLICSGRIAPPLPFVAGAGDRVRAPAVVGKGGARDMAAKGRRTGA